jgi:exosortase/archaeosortase family protein
MPLAGPSGGRLTSARIGLRYPLSVAAIACPLFAVYFYPYADTALATASLQSYLSGYARLVGGVLSAYDSRVTVSGDLIAGPTFSMRIVKTCDAMEVNILLAAALAGFPMPLRRRLVAVAASVLLLTLANVLRLCMLFWLGQHAPTWFDRVHEILAPLFMVGCALLLFLIATSQGARRTSPPPARVGIA